MVAPSRALAVDAVSVIHIATPGLIILALVMTHVWFARRKRRMVAAKQSQLQGGPVRNQSDIDWADRQRIAGELYTGRYTLTSPGAVSRIRSLRRQVIGGFGAALVGAVMLIIATTWSGGQRDAGVVIAAAVLGCAILAIQTANVKVYQEARREVEFRKQEQPAESFHSHPEK